MVHMANMAHRLLSRISATVARILFPRRSQSASIRLGLVTLGILVVGASVFMGQWGTTALSSDDGSLVLPLGQEVPRSPASATLPAATPGSDRALGNDRPPAANLTTAVAQATTAEPLRAETPEADRLAQAPNPEPVTAGTPAPDPASNPATATSASAAPAQLPPDLDLYPPDIQRLMRQGYIVVGVPSFDTPPLYFEQNGELQGADINIAKSLGQKLDLEVRFDRQSKTLDELINRTARQEVDIAIGKLSTTINRLKKLHASPNYIRFKQALLIDRTQLLALGGKDAESIQKLLKTEPISIGVIGKSSYEQYAKQNFPNAEVIGFPGWTEATEALATGQVFSIYRDENEIKKIIMSQPQLAIRLKSVLFNDLEDNKTVYVSLANPQLAHVIDNIILNDATLNWTSDRLIDAFYDIYTNPEFASN